MRDIRVLQSDFLTTATEPASYPAPGIPEIAFVGRSNVGKSSLINALTHRKKMVRVSNTPGRTRALNFFDVRLLDGRREQRVRLCDLPGYGYAKVSKAERKSWEGIIETYLRTRESLAAVVQIVDAEVGPTPQDLETGAWLGAAGKPVVTVATKLDRINKAKRKPALRAHEKALRLPEEFLLGVSSEDGAGLPALWAKLLELAFPRSA